MSRVVRSSKYRHVFGTVAKKEDCYDDLRITRTAWDSNLVCANPSYIAVIYQAAGGGAFAVIPHSMKGKVSPNLPLVTGHKGEVLDIDFNPFNDNLIASASDDGTAKVWSIPEGGLTSPLTEPVQNLVAHKRKVGSVLFNPVANNIMATSSTDYSVKIWDIEKGKPTCSIDAKHADIIQSVDWNCSGSLLATACKDKKIRIIDPRAGDVVKEVEGHQGVKGARVCWVRDNRLFTTGFNKTSEREYAVWDGSLTNLERQSVDSASGLLVPFFDSDTNVLYLAGKGDGNIRYFEVVDEAPYVHFLSEFKSSTPQRGMCLLPKRAVSVADCEIDRLFKVSVSKIEPISFQVPRKSEIFQDDIFPDCFSGEPSLTADEWLSGKNGKQKTRSMAPGFIPKEKPVVEFKPVKEEEKPLSEREMKDLIEKLKNRVAFLESEIIKKDNKISELQK